MMMTMMVRMVMLMAFFNDGSFEKNRKLFKVINEWDFFIVLLFYF
jgi:hypothetical protein